MSVQFEPGLDRKKVEELSYLKDEPKWMLEKRLQGYDTFISTPLPNFGPSLGEIDFSKLTYYSSHTEGKRRHWNDVPEEIRQTFERLGIPEAERRFLAGVEAQFDSTVVYDNIKRELEKEGIIFMDMDTAVKEHPELVKRYFGSVVPPSNNKFAALNTAMWSGGAFVYIPAGVEVKMPLQAYFQINTRGMGQFERTLIIVEKEASVTYIEGCTAPFYPFYSLHSGVVEIIVKERAMARYITVQNWAKNIYNLVTKRAVVYDDARVEWIDGNIGSKVTMKYPGILLKGKRSVGRILSLSYSGTGQTIDTGTNIFHLNKETRSEVQSKSVLHEGSIANYRAFITSSKDAEGSKSMVDCSSLLISSASTATYPKIKVGDNIEFRHEATISAIEEEKLYYLMSRGISRSAAQKMLILGYADDFIGELPFEYAIEFNRLIQTDVEDGVG